MAEKSDVKKLEMRISQLEELVAGSMKREAVDISAEEMRAYQKVRDVIAADYGEFCGINDCFRCIIRCLRCQVCSVCQICQRCDFECVCGPCNVGGLGGRLDRFSGLGG